MGRQPIGRDRSIVVITDDSDRHGYFAESLIESGLPVIGVITGAKRRISSSTSIPKKTLAEDEREALRAVKRHRRHAEQVHFEGAFERFATLIGRKSIWWDRVSDADGDINHPRFVEKLTQASPALVAVMGATLLRQPLLALPTTFLNVHTGLSPYYRGGRTNMWPIIEQDFGYFGVTVHRIAPGIDNGAIYASKRILTEPGDTYATINARAIKAGTDALINTIERGLPDGAGVEQWHSGKLFLDRHYSPAVAKQYLAQLPAYIDEHIRRQRTGQLATVRLVDPFG